MNTLDNPNFNPHNTVSPRPIAIKWGLISGGIAVAISLIGYLSGTLNPASGFSGIQLIWTLLGLAAGIYCIYMMQTIHRDQELGGFMSLGTCVGLGAISGAVSGAISGAFSAILFGLIEPNYMRDAMMKGYQDQGLSEEQMEMTMKIAGMFTSPVAMLITGPIGGVISGVILGLIVGFFTKKDRF